LLLSQLFAFRISFTRIPHLLLSLLFAFLISFTRIPYLLLTIALYDFASYIQQYSYDIDLTWIAVE
ncbi:hypothetical protein AB6D02_00090, partial [Vibrio splendidus]